MREHDGKRHELLRFTAGIPEHHALIARADHVIAFPTRLHLGRGVHAQRDIGRLPVDKSNDAALVIGKIARIVADLADDAARHLLIVDVGAAGDLARQKQRIVRRAAFHRRAGLRILFEKLVKNGIRNVVADLIGVTFGHALTCKNLFISCTL